MSILLYGCTTWTQIKHMEKKLNGNYTKMLQAVLNNSWRQHPTKQQHSYLPPIMKTIQIRWNRHAGHYWRNKDKFINDVLLWTLFHRRTGVDDQLELISSSSVLIQDVAWKTCWERWMIETSGERGSWKSMLAARHDKHKFCSW